VTGPVSSSPRTAVRPGYDSGMGFLRANEKRTTSALAWIEGIDGSRLKASTNPGGVGESVAATVQLRVVPDGQPEFNSEAHVMGRGDVARLPLPRKGHQTYVLYDPGHPEHCEIDRDRLRREFGDKHRLSIPQWVTEERQTKAAEAADGPAPTPAAPSSVGPADDVIAGLAKLGELHANGTLTDAEFAEAKARLLRSTSAD
jgi:hypothetical protein